MLIAASAASALRDQHSLARAWQDPRCVSPVCASNASVPTGTCRIMSAAGMPGAIRAFAVAPAVGLEFAVVAIAQQACCRWDSLPDKYFRRGRHRHPTDRRAARTSRDETRRSRCRRLPPSLVFWLRQQTRKTLHGCTRSRCTEISRARSHGGRIRRSGRAENTKAVRHQPNRLSRKLA